MIASTTVTLTAGSALPTEFKIFSSGKVETTKGTFIFDAAAAKSVMAEYQAHAIDLMIDYDHASISPLSLDPSMSGKAAGWFQLAVRNGELWAIGVRWTPGAAAQLRAKEWRYMSPAFATEATRITSLLNVAITNLPATRRLEPLMAANKGRPTMPPTPPQNTAPPLPADPVGTLAQIAKLLGLADASDPDACSAAFAALVDAVHGADPAEVATEGRRLGLTPGERAACIRMKCSPSSFVAARAATRGSR